MKLAVLERFAHYLAVEVNSGGQHPISFTGGPRVAATARRMGITRAYSARHALADVVDLCYVLDAGWRPTRHIQRALGWTDSNIEPAWHESTGAWLLTIH